MQKMNRTLGEAGGGVVAIIDDNYPMGPPDILFEANNKFKEDLKEVGLELQLKKSACYIDEKFRNEEWHRRRGSLPEGKLDKDDPNCTDFGIEV